MHSIAAKRIVIGRSAPYDTLYHEYTSRSKKSRFESSIDPLPSSSSQPPQQSSSLLNSSQDVKYAPEKDIVALVHIIQTFRPHPLVSSKPFSIRAWAIQRDYDQIQEACKQ
jgi:hypothetical protein